MLGRHGDDAEHAAETERAGVAHEDLGRIGIVPEEAHARADHGGEQHGNLARAGRELDAEVFREDEVTREIGDHRIGGSGKGHRHDREAVEPVGEVHRIGAADHDDHAEEDEEAAERQEVIVHEGHRDAAGEGRVSRLDGCFRRHAGDDLGEAIERAPLGMADRRVGAMQAHDESTGDRRNAEADQQARAGRDAIGALLRYLGIIIEEAEQRIGERHEQHDPDIGVAQIAPEQHADQQADPDEHAAHRGCALLRQLLFKRQITDRLALALTGPKHVDDHIPEHDRHEEGRHHSRASAEGDIVQQIEETAIRGQPFVQHHLTSAASCALLSILPKPAAALRWRKRSAIRPIPEAFDPLIKSTSPSRTAFSSAFHSSSALGAHTC